MNKLLSISLTLVMMLTLAGVSQAGEIEGVTFADEVRFEEAGGTSGAVLKLHGMALLRYRVIFRGYVAALYLPAALPAGEPSVATIDRVLDDIPRRLELSYFWAIGAGDFARAADDKFDESLDTDELRALRPRIDRLHAAYLDVEPGDRYALDYLPGTGTTLRYNGKALVTIPGLDFARAYFGLWLGDDPLDTSFRDALLRPEKLR